MAEQRDTKYWLFKSEPDVYGLDHLKADGSTPWDGVRNYQARNFMRAEMKAGDPVPYYHSRTDTPGVVGLARVASQPYPDPTQFDEESKYYDSKATEAEPRWILVDIAYVGHFDRTVSLAEMKADEALDGMLVTRRGQRLSVQPVEPRHFRRVLELADFEDGAADRS